VGENSSVRNYCEKPVFIEAIMYTGTQQNVKIINSFTGGFAQVDKDSSDLIIYTMSDGDIRISKGELIIKESVKGKEVFYPCKLADFVEYEPVEKIRTPLDECVRKYRKKPVKCKGIQYDGKNIEEIKAFTGCHVERDRFYSDIFIFRPNGSPLRVKEGEYIVGTIDVYKPREFASRYMPDESKKSLEEHYTQASLLRKTSGDKQTGENIRHIKASRDHRESRDKQASRGLGERS
jgi:hypothetical protein